MKKMLILAAFALVGLTASAQTASVPAIDTMANADTSNLVTPLNYFSGADGIFSASVVVTKISGTTAGTCVIQGSIDGVNYTNLTGTSADSLTLANVATPQVKNWYMNGYKPTKVRVRCITSGTQSTQIKSFYIKK